MKPRMLHTDTLHTTVRAVDSILPAHDLFGDGGGVEGGAFDREFVG